MRVRASCAAMVSAGPTGRPARRSKRAKCMTLAAMRGCGWFNGSWLADIRIVEDTRCVGARGEVPPELPDHEANLRVGWPEAVWGRETSDPLPERAAPLDHPGSIA